MNIKQLREVAQSGYSGAVGLRSQWRRLAKEPRRRDDEGFHW